MCQSTKKYSLPIESMLSMLKSDKKFKSIVTIKSKLTNKDFTFKLKRKEFNGKMWTHIYVERNYLEFMYLGWFDGKSVIRKGVIQDSPSALAIAWCLKHLYTHPELVNTNTEWYHTGSCIKCSKTLTDATSIELGIGPNCRQRV